MGMALARSLSVIIHRCTKTQTTSQATKTILASNPVFMANQAFLHLALLLLLLCSATQGDELGADAVGRTACRSADLVVRQSATGRVVEGKPEYAVEVTNRCRCAQSRVLLRCYGLSSVEAVDPRVIRPVDGERCLLRGGRRIPSGAPVRFKYAWMTPFDFPLVSSQAHC
ncbi:hypothetical protein CFC21_101569 [Triticum aestivum]|uniref:Uncharacterized protein n=3 Tax=Triticum aestivum TaxID=4565 RepID=A0A3B6SEQ1_WHEAT|nr:hypothetical protein CFC21_101569 [Triticum aestivum]